MRRLEAKKKGSAFAYEMTLDTHRYGALIVLDRWSTVLREFGPSLDLSRSRPILGEGPARIRSAENILNKINQLVDSSGTYSAELVEACILGFQSLQATFAEERSQSEQFAQLGPMLPEDYTAARRIFLEDLAVR